MTTNKKTTSKKDVAEIVTQRFIDALNGGRVPWIRPWEMWTSWSRATGNGYQGANLLTLSGGEYMTFKQAKEEGVKINKGAKSEIIVKYTEYKKTIDKEDLNKAENILRYRPDQIEDLGNGKVKVPAKSIKYYNVFNVEACTDAEQKHDHKQTRHEWNSIEEAEKIAAEYIEREGLKIIRESNQPCYKPGLHEIETGRKEQFRRPAGYYSTLFHELVHSTMKTLKRTSGMGNAKGSKGYAREELVAEIGAAYIMSYLGIEDELTTMNSNEYVRGGATRLGSDPNAILWAAPKAIEAAELIIKAAN
jgi:antirestriction protein ArdC